MTEQTKKSFSSLSAEQKREWLSLARMKVYVGLEPANPMKEAAIPVKARELYYEAE